MKFGQTLVLSGLTEQVDEKHNDSVPGLDRVPGLKLFASKKQKHTYRKSILMLLTPRRPDYVTSSRREHREATKDMSPRELAVEKLDRRYRDWFTPLPNETSIFQELHYNEFYQEFRTGDFALQQWQNSRGHEKRLRQALKYLYY